MMTSGKHSVLIISAVPAEARTGPVLGTGGWLLPEEREALDWHTLVHFLGWPAQLVTLEELTETDLKNPDLRCLIVTGAPDTLPENASALILEKIRSENCLLVARAGKPGGRFADLTGISIGEKSVFGKSLEWCGAGASRSWQGRDQIETPELRLNGSASVWAKLDGQPILAACELGAGRAALLSFHPSAARDLQGVFTALLRHLLIQGGSTPAPALDWSGTVVLRMDDPGSAQTVYHNTYENTKLGLEEWKSIGQILKKHEARMSIGYVPGWVDDGDAKWGQLWVNGQIPERVPGKIYPAPQIRYQSNGQANPPMAYDYAAEFSGIQQLRKAGQVEVEVHGFTHIHPDKKRWLAAEDKHTNSAWYREFSRSATAFIKTQPETEHPLNAGLQAVSDYFQTRPGTLICPGDEFTHDTLEMALQLGFDLVSSYYTCVRIGKSFCWTQHVCAPYLDQADPAWFDSELPVIGYFHDFDVSRHGVDWLARCLEDWVQAGARRFIDFRAITDKFTPQINNQTRPL